MTTSRDAFAPTCRPLRSERGVSIVTVAISLLSLMALSALVLDYGVLWLARGQAQNAADAGAHAGVLSLAFNSYGDRTNAGPAHQAGLQAISQNLIVGAAGGAWVDQAMDATTWSHVGPPTCVSNPGSCVQADVYRDGTHSSAALPTYFANLWGLSTQSVKATATAQLLSANSVRCMKPWLAEDKTDTTTYTLADAGTLLVLRANTGPSHYLQADFAKAGADCHGGGGACYGDSITHCRGIPPDQHFSIGDMIGEKHGNTNGKQNQDDIYNEDPTATWNTSTKQIDNSCARNGTCTCSTAHGGDGCSNGMDGAISPRIIAVGLFKPSDIAGLHANAQIPVQHFGGVFMLQPGTGPDPACTAASENVCGYLTTLPGKFDSAAPVVPTGGSTVVTFSLVR